jgi:hypothetical protein
MTAMRSRLVYLEGQPYWKHADGGFEKIHVCKQGFPERPLFLKTGKSGLKRIGN